MYFLVIASCQFLLQNVEVRSITRQVAVSLAPESDDNGWAFGPLMAECGHFLGDDGSMESWVSLDFWNIGFYVPMSLWVYKAPIRRIFYAWNTDGRFFPFTVKC